MQTLDVFTCPLEGISQIEASAGTGKTWTICALYIRLLLEKGLTVEHILVVTFTRAATAELQSRIRGRLTQVLYVLESLKQRAESAAIEEIDLSGDVFIDGLLTRVLGGQVSYEVARLRIEQAIQNFDQAAICTIHSFCQRALQEMPFSAAQPFEWTFSQDDGALRQDVALKFWRQYVEPAARYSPGFCAWLLEQKASPQSLDQELQKWLCKPLAAVKFPAFTEKALAQAESERDAPWSADQTIDPVLKAVLVHSLVLQSTLTQLFEEAHTTWERDKTSLFEILHTALPALHGRFYTTDTLAQARAAWVRFFAQNSAQSAPEPKSTLLRSTVLASRTKKNKTVPQHVFFMQAEALLSHWEMLESVYTQLWLSLLHIWFQQGPPALKARKQTQGIMSFDDLLSTLYRLLQARPELVRALNLRYQAGLIDEFQDTDPLQWSIFQTIFTQAPIESAALMPFSTSKLEQIETSAAPFTKDRPLFLVGDPKQAIYSFRAADLHTYLAARDSAKARYTLGTNQRSTEALVAACNQIFTVHAQAFVQHGLIYEAVYAGAAQRLAQELDKNKDEDKASSKNGDVPHPAGLWIWRLPEAPILSKQKALQASAQACAAEIARLLTAADTGLPPLDPSDIAVLVKTHTQGHYVKQVLGRWGIASVEMTPSNVLSSRSAEELEYLMRAVSAPQHIARLRAALSLDWFGLDADTLAPWTACTPEAQKNGSALSMDAAAIWIERFLRYKALWAKKGWAVMWKTLTKELNILPRIAASPEGERRLTDLMHINERIVTQAAQSACGKNAMRAVLRWFIKERHYPQSDPSNTQLRLESDRACVQILTIHRAKGLEYKVVFCPFLYEGNLRARSRSASLPQALEYHDETGQMVLDYRLAVPTHAAFGIDLPQEACIEAEQLQAIGAESARLIYVALTRAVYRCYVVAGLYTNAQGTSTKEARQSLLNWLVVGPQTLDDRAQEVKPASAAEVTADTTSREEALSFRSAFCAWMKTPAEAQTIYDAWQALSSEAIMLTALPYQAMQAHHTSQAFADKDAHIYQLSSLHTVCQVPKAKQAQRFLYDAGETGKITSFSALTHNLPAATQYWSDAAIEEAELEFVTDASPTGLRDIDSDGTDTFLPAHEACESDDDIVHFPRGAAAGECLHSLFEQVDFAQAATWPAGIERALSGSFWEISGSARHLDARWPAMMMRLLHDVTHTPLEWVAPGFTLSHLTPLQQRTEFEFLFPATISVSRLAPIFAEYGYADLAGLMDISSFSMSSEFNPRPAVEGALYPGYVRGFIDLVFEHAGRFWIVDWKSNDLGDKPVDYRHSALQRAMVAHRYHVQAMLYTLALHRYLQHYVPDYAYQTHFGGYLYIFVRGTRPSWEYDGQPCGVYANTPDAAFIQKLDSTIR